MANSCWSVVVPVKPLRLAKSRLRGLPDVVHDELVVAMAADTVAAALACSAVDAVYVVTSDSRVGTAAGALGAVVVPDEPDAGLNPALVHGAEVAGRARPDCGVAALAADLPALRPADLEAALGVAADCARAMVADAAGAGTTLLTAAPGLPLRPAYGETSRRRHLDDGVTELTVAADTGLRQDVDTMADLAAAERVGIGTRTAAVLRRMAAVRAGGASTRW